MFQAVSPSETPTNTELEGVQGKQSKERLDRGIWVVN